MNKYCTSCCTSYHSAAAVCFSLALSKSSLFEFQKTVHALAHWHTPPITNARTHKIGYIIYILSKYSTLQFIRAHTLTLSSDSFLFFSSFSALLLYQMKLLYFRYVFFSLSPHMVAMAAVFDGNLEVHIYTRCHFSKWVNNFQWRKEKLPDERRAKEEMLCCGLWVLYTTV